MPRLAPPSTSSPMPVRVAPLDLGAVGRRGAGHQPARLLLDPAEGGRCPRSSRAGCPAWLAPVCEDRSVSPLDQAVLPRRASAPCWRRSRRASRAAAPGARGRRSPGRRSRACRCRPSPRSAARALDHAERVGVVVVRAEDDLEGHADRRGDEGASKRPPERVDGETASRISEATHSIAASAKRTSRKPSTSVNGSRSAASTGRKALSGDDDRGHESGPKPSTGAPGTIAAATTSAKASRSHETRRRVVAGEDAPAPRRHAPRNVERAVTIVFTSSFRVTPRAGQRRFSLSTARFASSGRRAGPSARPPSPWRRRRTARRASSRRSSRTPTRRGRWRRSRSTP